MFRFLLMVSASVFARELPPEAKTLLNQLPEKRLTLDLVVHRAIATSESYKATTAGGVSVMSAELKAESLLDPQLEMKAGWQDDKREPTTSFSPSRIYGTKYSLGVSKYFFTGTALSFDVSHSNSNLVLPSIGDVPAIETTGTLSVSQNLWKDAFGSATRSALKAGEHMTRANEFALRESKEAWFSDIAQIYYGVWLSQSQLQAAQQSLKRRERLMKILGIRLARGTSETPNVLQVQGAYKATKVQVSQAEQVLNNQWRALCTVLKLPDSLENIDPLQIPVALDFPFVKAKTACGSPASTSPAPKSTSTLEKSLALSQAAAANLESASAQKNPTLKVMACVGNNAVESDSGNSFSEFTKNRFPYLAFGVVLSVPIGFSAEQAEYLSASAENIRAAAMASVTKDTVEIEWKNMCQDLYRKEEARLLYEEAFQNQEKRERLEEQRFRLGRASTFEVIQAGDDANGAELALRAAEVEYRNVAWKINRMSGNLAEYLKELETRK